MGCTHTHPDLSEEEVLLTSWEEVLGFYTHDVRKIDFLIRKHSFGKYIHKNHLNAVIKSLKLLKINDTQHPHVQDFYKMYETADGYLFQEFLVTGILLSAKPQDKKSKLLFEAFDKNAEDVMGGEGLGDMFKMIADICVDYVTMLFSDRDELRKAKVQSYIARLRSNKLNFVSKMVKKVLAGKSQVSKIDFMNIFKEDTLFNTYEIRKAIEMVRKSPPMSTSSEFKSNQSASNDPISFVRA
jgi:hypothetical protein